MCDVHVDEKEGGRGGRVVRCRIAMPEVVSSDPGRGKIN